LREARRLLAPGGRIVLTNLAPGISRLWHRWAFWDEDQHERGMAEGEVWGFRHDELVALPEPAGFRLVRREPFCRLRMTALCRNRPSGRYRWAAHCPVNLIVRGGPS
jgi:hypothetical protein